MSKLKPFALEWKETYLDYGSGRNLPPADKAFMDRLVDKIYNVLVKEADSAVGLLQLYFEIKDNAKILKTAFSGISEATLRSHQFMYVERLAFYKRYQDFLDKPEV